MEPGSAGDLELFFFDVAGELDHFHAVEQGGRDGHGGVGGGDEHHPRQVVGQLEVVVGEGVVLLGVEHFKQSRGGVAAEILAQLVDLVEHEERVDRAGPAHGLQDTPGSAPM